MLSRKREGKFDDHFALRQDSIGGRCPGKGKEKFDDDFSPRQDSIFMQMQLIQPRFPGLRAGCKSALIGFTIKHCMASYYEKYPLYLQIVYILPHSDTATNEYT